MVEAQNGRAVKGHILHELDKGVLHPGEIAVVIEMFGVDVSDDGDGAVQPEEGAVALVGLNHHPFALAQPGVGAIAVDDAAVRSAERRVGEECVSTFRSRWSQDHKKRNKDKMKC